MPIPSRGLRPFVPQTFGRYTLLAPIAKGGMGAVFLARMGGAEGFEKLVVIKKILPALAQEKDFVDRFVDEAKIVVKLHHGAIAQVLDMGVGDDGSYFIAMEFVDGKDLRKICARFRDIRLPVPTGLAIFVAVRTLDALAYAHRKKDDQERDLNLVHRDVSPQNVLVSYEGEVKLTDFGLAKSALSLGRTHPNIILGKFFYMSPEQARHQPVDRRSDLYSAGICLWELLAGKNPFDDVPPDELMRAVANPAIPSIRQLRPDLPESVDLALRKALSPNPATRYASAEEMRGRLTTVMLEVEPLAGPESLATLMRSRFSREYEAERRAISNLAKLGVAAEAGSEAAARPAPEPAPRPRSTEQTEVVRISEVAHPDRPTAAPLPMEDSDPAPTPRSAKTPFPSEDSDPAPTPRSAKTPFRWEEAKDADPAPLVGFATGSEARVPGLDAGAPGEPSEDPSDEPFEPSGEEALDELPPRFSSRALTAVGVSCLVAAVAIAVVVFRPSGRVPLSATRSPISRVAPVPEPLPATPPVTASSSPSPAVPTPDPVAATPALEPAEPVAPPEPVVTPSPLLGTPEAREPATAGTDPGRRTPRIDASVQRRRLELERHFSDISRSLARMKEVFPCDRIGPVCTHAWASTEEDYLRMIESPPDYVALARMLREYATALDTRRKVLELPAQ